MTSKSSIQMVGDLIIDWIIHNDRIVAYPGGVGNVYRGLEAYGFLVELTTLWNPLIFPLGEVFNLTPQSVQDLNYCNVYTRNYDTGIFQRFKEGLRPDIFVVSTDVAILHEESCVREVKNADYVDARDTSTKGTTTVLRLSSDNDWKAIMARWNFQVALVTYYDHVELFYPGRGMVHLSFNRVAEPLDTIGAGDVFSVGFLRSFYSKPWMPIEKHIDQGVGLAQHKVEHIGVFHDGVFF